MVSWEEPMPSVPGPAHCASAFASLVSTVDMDPKSIRAVLASIVECKPVDLCQEPVARLRTGFVPRGQQRRGLLVHKIVGWSHRRADGDLGRKQIAIPHKLRDGALFLDG